MQTPEVFCREVRRKRAGQTDGKNDSCIRALFLGDQVCGVVAHRVDLRISGRAGLHRRGTATIVLDPYGYLSRSMPDSLSRAGGFVRRETESRRGGSLGQRTSRVGRDRRDRLCRKAAFEPTVMLVESESLGPGRGRSRMEPVVALGHGALGPFRLAGQMGQPFAGRACDGAPLRLSEFEGRFRRDRQMGADRFGKPADRGLRSPLGSLAGRRQPISRRRVSVTVQNRLF